MSESFENGYKEGTIDIETMPDGGRDLELYEKELMFSRDELAGKDVLDLGTGPELKLAEGLKAAGVTAHVVSMSPDFSQEKHRERAQKAAPGNEMVAGLGQQLPFGDETFDVVLANHVVQHLENRKRYYQLIMEAARALKKGGKAIIGPMYDRTGADPLEQLNDNPEVQDAMARLHTELSIAYIPKDVKPALRIDMGGGMYSSKRVQAFNIIITKVAEVEESSR
ncbi:MAG: class I SAM-dependent methyltransferase [Patescibacteria group bacterium]